jgi:cell division protein FtsI (penicillin-binding protein 3)
MAQKVGKESHKRFLGQLGMMKSVQIELFETGAPIPPKVWRDINHMTISYGHGLAVSPLHLVAGVSAIVNGGIYRTPTIMRRHPGDPAKGRRIVSNQTSIKMRHLMRLVVEKGTGGKAAVPGYLVGGKTGTAEKASGRGYKKKALISSFVAAFPMNSPQFVVLTMLDEAKGNEATSMRATGGWVAAPAAGAIIRRIAPILALKPIGDEVSAAQKLAFKSKTKSVGGPRVAAH